MKKSQILAAIALAMALGVVAPVVNANAATQQGDATLTTNSQKAADAAVKEVKQSFSAIKTVDADGDLDKEYTGAAAYGYISTNASALSTALDYVKNAEKNGGDIAQAFKTKVGTYTYDGSSLKIEISGITEIANLFNGTDSWTGANLATAKATVAQIITLVNNAANAETNQATKTNLQMISHNLQEVITDAEVQKLVDADVAAGDTAADFDDLKDLYLAFTGQAAGAITTEAKLNNITGAVKNGFGAANWSKYLRVSKLINKIEGGLANGSASDVELDAWVAQLKGAANGNGETPVTPAEPGVNAPATGIAGTAEGTATTVSIVAGLATALTALGAGVVAYRSARRK